MGYSRRTHEIAKEIMQKRRDEARMTSELHRTEINSKFPEIKALNDKIADTYSEIVATFGRPKEEVRAVIEDIEKRNLVLQEKRNALLVKNGYPENYMDINYHCPVCQDEGYVLGTIKECKCYRAELSRIALEESGLGSLVKSQTFESFDLDFYKSSQSEYEQMKHNYLYLMAYVDSFDPDDSPSLIFIGATGLGKTHLSTAVASGVIAKGYNVVYESSQNILSDFEREKFRRDSSSQDQRMPDTERYFDCDLLIIDDLGTELTNNFTVTVLYNLINSRANDRKPVIINTNLSIKEINTRYDQRITSRLLGSFQPLQFFGKDIRMQKLNL
ncbi:MAG: DNA replication protein DnaC [Ruminococcaceae bacterium]|nr:DNA replication protein DnaC [Oscillospiraceae bacterium]